MDLDKQTRRDERLETMRKDLLLDGCPPKLAEEMVRDARNAVVQGDIFGLVFDPLFGAKP